MFGFTGCSGSVNAAILFLSNGDAFRDYSAGLLWSAWKLDCLSDQCSLRRVPKQKRERECQLQEPCYSGKPCEKAHNFMELKFLNFSIQKLIYIYIYFSLFWIFGQWFEVLDGLLGPYWKAAGLAFNCTFLLFGSVIQLIACARSCLLLFQKKFFSNKGIIKL